MITAERITPANAMIFKAVRLNALKDTPDAFSSTYAKESELTDQQWIDRAAEWNGTRGVAFLAMKEGNACGIAGSFLNQQDPTRAVLISMWVAPGYRRRGIGQLLVDEIANWARSRHVRSLELMVTSVNDSATRFYERLGFQRTGRTEPYPHNPTVLEYEMSKLIS